MPHVADENAAIYTLNSELGTAFTNCTIHAPLLKGQANAALVDRYGFIALNKSVRYYHLNTRLGNDILQYMKGKNISLQSQFIEMLKAHHALEGEGAE